MPAFLLRSIGILLMLSALAATLAHAPDRSVDSLVARWAPPPSDFMVVKGQLVHYRDEGPRGDPAPLVLLHGMSSSLHTWEGWVAGLRASRRVITFDLPAFGLTGPFTGQFDGQPYLGDTYARFTLDVLEALQVQRFDIGGNSLGGEVAWRVASLAPERAQRLILVDSTGYPTRPDRLPVAWQFARLPVLGWIGESLTPRALVEDGVRASYGDPSRVTSALVDRYFELALREGNRHALRERLRVTPGDFDPGRLRTLRLPTLVLWGAQDRLIPPDTARRFAQDIAGSRLVMLPGLGHVPQEEDPVASLVPVRSFLNLPPAAAASSAAGPASATAPAAPPP